METDGNHGMERGIELDGERGGFELKKFGRMVMISNASACVEKLFLRDESKGVGQSLSSCGVRP